jgi:hypothetical protein
VKEELFADVFCSLCVQRLKEYGSVVMANEEFLFSNTHIGDLGNAGTNEQILFQNWKLGHLS